MYIGIRVIVMPIDPFNKLFCERCKVGRLICSEYHSQTKTVFLGRLKLAAIVFLA